MYDLDSCAETAATTQSSDAETATELANIRDEAERWWIVWDENDIWETSNPWDVYYALRDPDATATPIP